MQIFNLFELINFLILGGGDTGGPLTQNGDLVGLISWGDETCGSGQPAIYTKVTHPKIHSWILQSTAL